MYAYSFIATNLDVSTPARAVAAEARHRMRTDIEDRIRDAKHGAALRHLPSAAGRPTPYGCGALCWPSTSPPGCRSWPASTAATATAGPTWAPLRHRLLNVPARLFRHAGQVILRLPPGQQLPAHALSRLRRLPTWT